MAAVMVAAVTVEAMVAATEVAMAAVMVVEVREVAMGVGLPRVSMRRNVLA